MTVEELKDLLVASSGGVTEAGEFGNAWLKFFADEFDMWAPRKGTVKYHTEVLGSLD